MSEMTEEITQPENENQPEQVDPNAYEQVKNDMFKYKRTLQEKESELSKLREEIRSKEEEAMAKNNQYKELYERAKADLENVSSEKQTFVQSVLEDKKISAVKEYAMKKGISDLALNDLELLSMDGVVVETTDQGRINVLGADEFVEELKKNRPHWFSNSNPPKINNNTGDFDGQEKKYTASELLQLQKKDPELYKELITKKRHLIARR